jgi:hypothetical protein
MLDPSKDKGGFSVGFCSYALKSVEVLREVAGVWLSILIIIEVVF